MLTTNSGIVRLLFLLCTCRMIESGNIKPAFMSSISVVKSTCRIIQLVQWYQVAVLSFQLLLKLAEIVEAALRKQVIISSLSIFAASLRTIYCN